MQNIFVFGALWSVGSGQAIQSHMVAFTLHFDLRLRSHVALWNPLDFDSDYSPWLSVIPLV